MKKIKKEINRIAEIQYQKYTLAFMLLNYIQATLNEDQHIIISEIDLLNFKKAKENIFKIQLEVKEYLSKIDDDIGEKAQKIIDIIKNEIK